MSAQIEIVVEKCERQCANVEKSVIMLTQLPINLDFYVVFWF